MSDASSTREALLVVMSEGTAFAPGTAFLASALRRQGLVPRLLPTDFCTTREGFQNDVASARPYAVVFVDAVEWREIVAFMAGFAVEAGAPLVLVAEDAASGEPGPWPQGVRGFPATDLAALAAALDLPAPAALDLESLPLDVGIFGGPALLDRALGCSLFGDLGTVALVGVRRLPREASPAAALARFEGSGPADRRIVLPPSTAHAPLAIYGPAVRAVEWTDRDFFDATLLHPSWAGAEAADRAYLTPLRDRGLFQTVRLNARVPSPMLETLRDLGVGRVVFDCDALHGSERLPAADATAAEVAHAVEQAHAADLEAGVLFVVGLPDETPAETGRRTAQLRAARPDRLRVTPFEPTGGASSSWCARRRLWPPLADRWNREIHQPLRQHLEDPDAYVKSFETALVFAAEISARCGAPRESVRP